MNLSAKLGARWLGMVIFTIAVASSARAQVLNSGARTITLQAVLNDSITVSLSSNAVNFNLTAGLLAFPAVKLKFTAFDDSDTVMESFNTACKVIVRAPEFSTCARALDATAMVKITIPSQRAPSFADKFIEAFALQRETVRGREL